MWAFAFLLSTAIASEIGLNATVFTDEPSTTSSTSPAPTPSASLLNKAAATQSLISDPYGPPCDPDNWRYCPRTPEQPYFAGMYGHVGDWIITHNDSVYQNPWFPENFFASSLAIPSYASSVQQCSIQYDTRMSQYLSTAPLTQYDTVYPATGDAWTSTSLTYSIVPTVVSGKTTSTLAWSTDLDVYAAFTPWFYAESFTFTATPPCCSSCTIFGGNIQVFYWGSTALASGTTTLVNEDGFTFTSPSVYVALQTLEARDYCGPVGHPITSSMLAFNPGEIVTARAYHWANTTEVDWDGSSNADFQPATWGTEPCEDIVTTLYYDQWNNWSSTVTPTYTLTYTYTGEVFTTTETVPSYLVTYNPCSPYLSVPTQIITQDPLWTQCKPVIDVVLFDPPSVLRPGVHSLTSVSSTTADPQSQNIPTTTTSSSAAAGPTLTSVTPTPTSTADPTTSSADPGDPGTSSSTSVAGDPPSDPTQTALDPTTSSTSSPGDPSDPSSKTPVDGNTPTHTTTSSPAAVDTPSSTVITIGSNTITENSSSGFVIGSQTLTPGGQITLSGTTISLASNGETLNVGSSTQVLVTPTYVIGTQTLSAGGDAITVSGTTYSLATGGSSVVVDGTTLPLKSLLGSPTPEFQVGSQTLIAGGAAITISGTPVSLQPGGSSVVIGGTKTEPLSSLLGSKTTTVQGLGGIIATMGGYGSKTSSVTSSISSSSRPPFNGTTFTAAATRGERGVETMGGLLIIGVIIMAWL